MSDASEEVVEQSKLRTHFDDLVSCIATSIVKIRHYESEAVLSGWESIEYEATLRVINSDLHHVPLEPESFEAYTLRYQELILKVHRLVEDRKAQPVSAG